MKRGQHPVFSDINDPIPDGCKPTWVSLVTGELIEYNNTLVPPGFSQWVKGRPSSRAIVMLILCTIGQYRFKCSMPFLARKCDMTPRGLQKCLVDLELGGWATRKETRRGGSLSGWNLFTVPHLARATKQPDYRRNGRSDMDSTAHTANNHIATYRPEVSDEEL